MVSTSEWKGNGRRGGETVGVKRVDCMRAGEVQRELDADGVGVDVDVGRGASFAYVP